MKQNKAKQNTMEGLWFLLHDLSRKSPVSCSLDSAMRRGIAGRGEEGWMCGDGTIEEEEEERNREGEAPVRLYRDREKVQRGMELSVLALEVLAETQNSDTLGPGFYF
ncbi:unnamed protein product [Pleuronectes platessa]|uniref:Uncharacterized protein n=1 Tax=Pleuronectes platessa TaxID=8262 RepID=A0A9N7VD56_PLEPL|nr:unnamed protein product [Pleuronectes platessa]